MANLAEPSVVGTHVIEIYGMKMLAKLFSSHQLADHKQKVKNFLNILLGTIQVNDSMGFSSASVDDASHLRFAAAKSILCLATRWDFLLTPEMFRSTIMISRDPSSIKKAKDAMDDRFTTNLHILSDIALSVIKKQSRQCWSSPSSPQIILLSSSFYKCPDTAERELVGPNSKRQAKSGELAKSLDSRKGSSNSMHSKGETDYSLAYLKGQKNTTEKK